MAPSILKKSPAKMRRQQISERVSKNRLANMLLLLGAILLSFLTAEFAFRIYLFGTNAFSVTKMNSVHKIGVSGMIRPSIYPELIYELKPHLDTYFHLVPFRTNASGMRDKEYPLAKPRDTYRVALVGDSFVLPSGVAIEEAFHTRIEDRLNREQSHRHYEFINFGVAGYSLRQYRAVIEHRVRKYTPNLIILGFCPSNDHLILPERRYTDPFVAKATTYPFFHSFIWLKLREIPSNLKRLLKRTKTSRGRPTQSRNIYTEAQQNYMQNLFTQIQQMSVRDGVPVVVLNISQVYNRRKSRALETIVSAAGLHFKDLTVAFRGAAIRDYRIYKIDAHPNNRAHRIFADETYAYLRAKRLI